MAASETSSTLFPRIGFTRFWSSLSGLVVNWPAVLAWVVALACLVLCLVLPMLVFAGSMDNSTLRRLLIWITLVYFAAGTTWMSQREKRKSPPTT